ncbi:aminotransferase [Actinocorallia aurea]
MRFNGQVVGEVDSPIEEISAMAEGVGGEVLDLAQAAPPYPAAAEVVEHVAAVARDGRGGAYTEVPGLAKLREAFAAELRREHGGPVEARNVMVTAGCNQAFCVAATALAGPGDEVVLALPYYFNHAMWLRMQGITPVFLEPGPDLVPRAADAEALLTPRTRAIVLVTPGNPTGVTIEPREIAAFAALARRHDVALVLDETYRSFRDAVGPSHTLYAEPDWDDAVVTLHSFSKDLALPGYRVGAVVGSPALLRQAGKLMDCAAICAPRIGQEAAWAGLTRASAWRAARVREVADRRALLEAAMASRPGGFELLSTGGFFAWIRHPFEDRPTRDVVRGLLTEHRVLVLPGTAFLPDDRATLRVSVSNAAPSAITTLTDRLHAFGSDPAP